MAILFTAEVIIQGQSKGYEVSFEKNKYNFQPAADTEGPAFWLYREHDEWKVTGAPGDIAVEQAIDQLESYLLSQH